MSIGGMRVEALDAKLAFDTVFLSLSALKSHRESLKDDKTKDYLSDLQIVLKNIEAVLVGMREKFSKIIINSVNPPIGISAETTAKPRLVGVSEIPVWAKQTLSALTRLDREMHPDIKGTLNDATDMKTIRNIINEITGVFSKVSSYASLLLAEAGVSDLKYGTFLFWTNFQHFIQNRGAYFHHPSYNCYFVRLKNDRLLGIKYSSPSEANAIFDVLLSLKYFPGALIGVFPATNVEKIFATSSNSCTQ